MPLQEVFKPFSNRKPDDFLGMLRYVMKVLLDFQYLTVYRDIRRYAMGVHGVVLDIGCGDCPYKHLFSGAKKYIGIDIAEAGHFDYGSDKDIMRFDGTTLPFPDHSIDHIVFSEVLEHIASPEPLIGEIYRVLKPGGDAFVTLPWSARYHYIPYDYARYTPSKLELLFSAFVIESITPRGSDITVICNKLIVAAARQVYSRQKIVYAALPFMLVLSPFMLIIVVWGQCSLWFNLGSTDDPLGYTIRLKKSLPDTQNKGSA